MSFIIHSSSNKFNKFSFTKKYVIFTMFTVVFIQIAQKTVIFKKNRRGDPYVYIFSNFFNRKHCKNFNKKVGQLQ